MAGDDTAVAQIRSALVGGAITEVYKDAHGIHIVVGNGYVVLVKEARLIDVLKPDWHDNE